MPHLVKLDDPTPLTISHPYLVHPKGLGALANNTHPKSNKILNFLMDSAKAGN